MKSLRTSTFPKDGRQDRRLGLSREHRKPQHLYANSLLFHVKKNQAALQTHFQRASNSPREVLSKGSLTCSFGDYHRPNLLPEMPITRAAFEKPSQENDRACGKQQSTNPRKSHGSRGQNPQFKITPETRNTTTNEPTNRKRSSFSGERSRLYHTTRKSTS